MRWAKLPHVCILSIGRPEQFWTLMAQVSVNDVHCRNEGRTHTHTYTCAWREHTGRRHVILSPHRHPMQVDRPPTRADGERDKR